MARMPERTGPAAAAAVVCLLTLLSGWSALAQEAYRVASGDALEVHVGQLPELNRRVTVNIDGNIALPMIGAVRAAGLPLEEIRLAIARRLAQSGTLNDPQVLVDVAQFRPVYVNGDVSKPGEYEFRPGLSIRQLASLAGGYDLLNFRSSNPMVQLPDFRAERDGAWLELTRHEIHIAFLQAELDGRQVPSLPRPDDFPIPESAFMSAVDLETRLAQARLAARERQREYLRRVISLSSDQVAALQEQRRQEEATVRQMTEDLGQSQSLLSRGLTSVTRVQENQRSISLAQSRAAEATANIARAGREREEYSHRLRSLDEERKAEVLDEIEKGRALAQMLRVRVAAANEKLLYAGALRSQLLRGARGAVIFVLHRRDRGVLQRLPADEDTVLLPGDAVEVTLSYDP